jgi:hypothetical protein
MDLIKTVVDTVTAGATLAIAVTGAWALIYASRQLKQSREDEKVRHLVEFSKEFDSEPMVTWRRKVAESRLQGEAFPDEAFRLLDFFETIGLLVRRGYLDEDDVWSMFSYWMFNIFADFREDVEQIRRDDDVYYGDFCDLIERLRVIEKESGGTDDRPSKDEIKEFWTDEANTLPGAPMKKHRRPTEK